MKGPKRLIEADLPIGKVSAQARREKSIRHGHISTLHIWWARRPLAACRAVILASLFPDPADPACPEAFRRAVGKHLAPFWERRGRKTTDWADGKAQRTALLDFLALFSDWERSNDPEFLSVARSLVDAAHLALGGEPGTRPLVVDPFAGGGAIPLEALRVGADAFASDLNPVAVLLNKVVLEYVPRFGAELSEAVREWGRWVKDRAEQELRAFYPKDPDGSTPIAYIWSRTIRCEGPGCGVEVPLIRSLWLRKKAGRGVALAFDETARREGRIAFRILGQDGRPVTEGGVGPGTVRRGSATCPVCGYTTPVARVREQLKRRRGGAADARLLAVVLTHPSTQGRYYRLATERDLEAARAAETELERRHRERLNGLPAVPDEPLPPEGTLGFRVQKYGVTTWGDLFTPRQLLALTTLAKYVREAIARIRQQRGEDFARAVGTCLGLVLDRQSDYSTSLCSWHIPGQKINHTFGRQALSMFWDYSEVNPFSGATGDWDGAVEWVADVCTTNATTATGPGQAVPTSATAVPLPDGLAQALVTDPPYYDAVPYADLSDFFYVWLRRTVGDLHPDLFRTPLVPKDDECVVNPAAGKDKTYFESTMRKALSEARRVLSDDGIAVVVFAHKSTAGWEAMLQALIEAGWTITGSWPIDTEMGTRLRARNSAALASSVHLACRPRTSKDVGDWRDVLEELPTRVYEWLPRLAEEGVVGADAIFACLGPALEVFSRYDRVEKPSGEAVSLSEYLTEVWAAVAREALSVIFREADASGFEEDARLTAMWLWTLFAGKGKEENGPSEQEMEDEVDDEEEEGARNGGNGAKGAFALDFDTARKIAQGLGVHLEEIARPGGIVEVKGESARLLFVRERDKVLLGRRRTEPSPRTGRGRRQATLFAEDPVEREGDPVGAVTPGSTTLNRLHQSMLLFAQGRMEAVRRLLVDEGVGKDARFWRLAQTLSALYPAKSEEKRWVDGVLASRRMLKL
jgi:putative DNA methylase